MRTSHKRPTLTPAQVVARRLRTVREKQGKTQADVALALNALGYPLDRSAIARAEKAERKVTTDELVYFALALGVSPATLLCLDDDDDNDMAVVPSWSLLPQMVRKWLTFKSPVLYEGGPNEANYWNNAPATYQRAAQRWPVVTAIANEVDWMRESAGRLPGNAITVATHLQKLRSLVDAACTAVVSDLEPGERKALWWDTQGRPLPPGVSPNDEAAD